MEQMTERDFALIGFRTLVLERIDELKSAIACEPLDVIVERSLWVHDMIFQWEQIVAPPQSCPDDPVDD